MRFDYLAAQISFFETAPDLPGYKHVYASTFSAILFLLQRAETRSVNINYDRLNGLLKMDEESYGKALKWLDEATLIQYVKGKNRHALGLAYINVPEILEPEKAGSTGGSKGVSTGGSTQGSRGVSSPILENNPPPHPPIEEYIINNPSLAGQASTASLITPADISLSAEEEAQLLQTYGPIRLTAMLLRVSEVKKKRGGLKTSDYNNVVKWAAQQILSEEAQVPKTRPTTARPIHQTRMVTTSTAKPFRELT